MKLTDHFSLKEFTDSAKAQKLGIENKPTLEHIKNLKRLSEKLEIVREGLNKIITITSGYRCPALNKAVGGEKTSKHLEGNAADINVSISLREVMNYCIKNKDKINYDKIIYETGKEGENWIHFQQLNDESKHRKLAIRGKYNHQKETMEYSPYIG